MHDFVSSAEYSPGREYAVDFLLGEESGIEIVYGMDRDDARTMLIARLCLRYNKPWEEIAAHLKIVKVA